MKAKLVRESLNEYYGRKKYFDGHPLSKYNADGSERDPYELSDQTVNGKRLTWDEFWDWYEREGETDY